MKLGDYGCPYFLTGRSGGYNSGPTVGDTPVNPLFICKSGFTESGYDMPSLTGGYWQSWQLGQFKYPSERIMVAEGPIGIKSHLWNATNPRKSVGYCWAFYYPKYPDLNRGTDTLASQPYPEFAGHNGSNNVSYVDGHAKAMKQSEMIGRVASFNCWPYIDLGYYGSDE
jgi:prepilin-type processing-associated H-X9-DG protein